MTTVYEKYYGRPDARLSMNYLLRKDTDKRVALYLGEGYSLPPEIKTEETVGIFCLKCGEYHEYQMPAYEQFNRQLICGCGKPFLIGDTVNTNCTAASRRSVGSIGGSFPEWIKITVQEGEKIHISVIGRNYYLNPKVMKPYTTAYQITVIINVASGQTYIMPAQYQGKKLFVDSTGVRTASYEHNLTLGCLSRVFFAGDPDAMAALEAAFKRLEPSVKRRLATLEDVARANFLKNLYDLFPHCDKSDFHAVTYAHREMYRTLKDRYRKDPDTFPGYLYHGCSKVATKSIKKALYMHPELKWALRYLYKTLGITNPDILRASLTDKRQITDTMACSFRGNKDAFLKIKALADACRSSGMSDKEIAAFFLIEIDGYYTPGIIRDTARMYNGCPLSPEELRSYKTMKELHDALVELEIRRRNQRQWERYNTEVSYEEPIYALEGPCDDAVFRIIKRPWELKSLGKRFHNCVGSYMEDLRSHYSIIVEMTIDEKPAACIELDGEGKICRQAFAACNQPLDGCAEASFKEWTTLHKISSGHMTPHMNYYDYYDFMPF